jgi:uncharacterized membrane protein YkoI
MRHAILIGLLSLFPLRADADDQADDTWSVSHESPRNHERAHDHERARAARLRGEIQPITEILNHIGEQITGEVIGIELEREEHDGQRVWIYELKILTPDGRRLEVEVDARDGQILELEDDD